ncbi:MAG TPA: hypothetical protein VFS42_00670, partial [Burkholderiaceae bacterium]|nr:hypothetical protein [Burkholderiaceae bacterium]
CGISDVQLESLKPLKDTLIKLSIPHNQVRGSGLKHLHGFSKLNELDLSSNNLDNNNCLTALSELTSLKTLTLHNSLLLDRTGLSHISKLNQLESLVANLRDELSDSELNALSSLSNLKFLYVHSDHRDYDGLLRAISKLTNLEGLSIKQFRYSGNISAQGIAQLQSLRNLKFFQCSLTTFNDAAFEALKSIPSLRRVLIGQDSLVIDAIPKFRKARPDVELDFI